MTQATKLSSRLPAAAKHNVQSSAVGFCFIPTNVSTRVGVEGSGKGVEEKGGIKGTVDN